MGRKLTTLRKKSQPKKVMKSRDSKCQISKKERQKLFQDLQLMNLDDDAQDSNNAEHSLLRVRDKVRTLAFPEKNSTFCQADANKCGNDDTCVNELCEYFSNIPPNLSSYERILQSDLTEQCEFDISFVQAIVCLKSTTVSQLSTKRLQQIFDRQWSTQDNHAKNKGSNEEQNAKQLERLNIEKPSTFKVVDIQDILMLTPRNVSDQLCNSSSVSSAQDKWDTVRNKRQKESLPEFDSAIPAMDEKLFNSNFDKSGSETFDSLAEHQMYDLKLNGTTECLTQPTSWNYVERADEEAAKNMVDTGNVPGNDFADVPFSWEAPCTQAADQNEQHKLTSSTPKQSDETNNPFQSDRFYDEAFITPNIITQPTPHDVSSPTFNNSPTNLTITPLDNVSLDRIDLKLDKPQDFDNFKTGNPRSRTDVSNNNRSLSEFDDLNKPNTPVSNVHNSPHDSAYSTEIHDYRVDETAKPAANKSVSYNTTRHHYNLRSSKKKETAMTSIDPSSVIYNRTETPHIECEKRPFVKKRKRGRPRKWIGAKWLDIALEALNMEHVVLESARVILTTVSDEKMVEEYATHRRWKNNLIGEAVNAVLNMSDVLRLEGKPDICRKPIITTVTETLDKIATCMRSDKVYVSQVYRVQIILELCNSVSVCVAIIDHLMARLKSFWLMLSQETEIRRDIHGTVNQLHFVFYALNIALRKYRTVVPNNGKAVICHVADLWKTRHIDEKFQHAKFNMNDAEERWCIVLEDLMIASKERFAQFVKELLSLIHVLNP